MCIIIVPILFSSFLYLSSSADIIRDFQSKTLQEEWNKFGTSVIQRRNERLQRLQTATAEQQQKRQAASAARHMRLSRVDAAVDSMQAKFADDAIALEYDASRLEKRFGFLAEQQYDDLKKDSKPLPCVGQRAHWIDCQKKYGEDSRPCNFYVQALEDCVRNTIGKTTISD